MAGEASGEDDVDGLLESTAGADRSVQTRPVKFECGHISRRGGATRMHVGLRAKELGQELGALQGPVDSLTGQGIEIAGGVPYEGYPVPGGIGDGAVEGAGAPGPVDPLGRRAPGDSGRLHPFPESVPSPGAQLLASLSTCDHESGVPEIPGGRADGSHPHGVPFSQEESAPIPGRPPPLDSPAEGCAPGGPNRSMDSGGRSHPGPQAVGTYDESGLLHLFRSVAKPDPGAGGCPAITGVDLHDLRFLPNLNARLPRRLQEGMVEAAALDAEASILRSEISLGRRSLLGGEIPAREGCGPRLHHAFQESELGEKRDASRVQALPAGLPPGKGASVHEGDFPSVPGQEEAGGGARRPSTHDEDSTLEVRPGVRTGGVKWNRHAGIPSKTIRNGR